MNPTTRTPPSYSRGGLTIYHADCRGVLPAYAELWRLLSPDTFCVSFYGWTQSDRFVGVWKRLGFRPVSHLAFVKNVWGLGRFPLSACTPADGGRHDPAD